MTLYKKCVHVFLFKLLLTDDKCKIRVVVWVLEVRVDSFDGA